MLILGHAMRACMLAIGLVGATLWPAQARAELSATAVTNVTQRPAPAATSGNPVALLVDFAMVIQIDTDIGTIVLGNSTIADATVTNGRMVVLTGKSVGMTNMIVLGIDNAVLAEVTLQVGGRKPGTVTVMRALKRQNYACETGLCKDTDLAEPVIPPDTIIAAAP